MNQKRSLDTMAESRVFKGDRSKTKASEQSPWDVIARSIDERAERLVKFRRRLHAMPEPSNEEFATTALIAETLREAGLKPRIMRGETGVIVDIDLGATGDSFIATRSELDCVKVNDDKQVAYASTRPGLSHACGHDVHTTVQLAMAMVLAEHRDLLRSLQFKHNLRLVFQPAEETSTGARSMIEQGAIDGVEAIIALHVEPFLDCGIIGLRTGPLTAACKTFRITVRGRSGHSARPYEAVDPIPAAINMISMMYQLCPRSMDSRHPLALTVASINAGSSFNAIPDEAVINGALRAARIEDIERVQQRMEAVARGMKESTGCDVQLEFLHSCPATENNPEVIGYLANSAASIMGDKYVIWLDVPSLGGEDFAYYQELIPGAIVRIGAGLPEIKARRPLHSSKFDVNENLLPIGTKILTRAALNLAADYVPKRA
jgi:amidohydrolase